MTFQRRTRTCDHCGLVLANVETYRSHVKEFHRPWTGAFKRRLVKRGVKA